MRACDYHMIDTWSTDTIIFFCSDANTDNRRKLSDILGTDLNIQLQAYCAELWDQMHLVCL